MGPEGFDSLFVVGISMTDTATFFEGVCPCSGIGGGGAELRKTAFDDTELF